MSAQQNPFEPEAGARGTHPPAENQAGENGQVNGESGMANEHLPINPQQSFREFTAPAQHGTLDGTPPVVPASPGFVQSGYAGQPQAMVPPAFPRAGQEAVLPGAQPGYASYPQSGYPGPVPPGAQPGYASYPQMVQPQPGYPQPGYAGQPQPSYAPHGAYPGHYPYPVYPGYPGHQQYGYQWVVVPQKPKRDTYLLVVGIVAFTSSCLVMLGGLASLGLMGLVDLVYPVLKGQISDGSYFATIMLLLTFALAGLVGGGFCLYHSIRSLFLRKPSRAIWLPRFWIFLLCYLATLGLGYWLHTRDLDISSPVLTGALIYLGGIFPALMVMALGIRRVSMSKAKRHATSGSGPLGARVWRWLKTVPGRWPTSWRRLALALVSGATLGVGLALILETIFQVIIAGAAKDALTQYLSNPNAGNPPPGLYVLLLMLVAVIAPLVEEMVKPLAVVVLIGRVRSKAEAFVLGLACGIGFNLVETTGYISSGYNNWLGVALERSGAGLLHGFGAAMVALSWYYLTHKEEGTWLRRLLLASGCATYAVLQHALWNGAVGLLFIPGPIGDFFQNWNWSFGLITLEGIELVYIVESIGMLTFFVYMSGRLRTSLTEPNDQRSVEAAPLPVEQSAG
ncbi:MAG TPA: PrsW family glutamic-type intramembrane protease [Ktedonobacteraceae bacterium]